MTAPLNEDFGEVLLVSIPITGGYIRYHELSQLVDALDGMPGNTLIEVLPGELRCTESTR